MRGLLRTHVVNGSANKMNEITTSSSITTKKKKKNKSKYTLIHTGKHQQKQNVA
jgi:hypothetical protein